MNRFLSALCILTVFLLHGCSGPMRSMPASDASLERGVMMDRAEAQAEPAALTSTPRQRSYTIKGGSLEIEVRDLDAALTEARNAVEAFGGITQQARRYEEGAALTLRVPVEHFDAAIAKLTELGSLQSSSINETDVTEQYIDLEAKTTNLRSLRDRLRALLDRAKTVKEVVAVEEQLTRVQIELDQLEGRLKHLQGQIAMSTLQVSLSQKTIPGPLGLLVHGAVWVVKKLFVLY